MGKSPRVEQSTDDRSILLTLKQEQQEFVEGSIKWKAKQHEIDKIIAQNYLRYLNN